MCKLQLKCCTLYISSLQEQYTKSGRKRKMLAEDSLLGPRRSKAALLAAHKTSKEAKRPVVDLDELSGMNADALESVLNEITGGEELPEEVISDVSSSRQKRKCVAVREKVTKLQQMLEKQGANQKGTGNAGSVRKRKTTQGTAAAAAAACSVMDDDDDDNITSILPVAKPAHKKNRFPFSSSRSRRHRRKREG